VLIIEAGQWYAGVGLYQFWRTADDLKTVCEASVVVGMCMPQKSTNAIKQCFFRRMLLTLGSTYTDLLYIYAYFCVSLKTSIITFLKFQVFFQTSKT
jgi:hypothetical protein